MHKLPLAIVVALALGACGDDSGGAGGGDGGGGADAGAPPINGLMSITVTPADQTLTIMGALPAVSAYHAMGKFNDGSSRDITSKVSFSLADGRLGSFVGAAFTSTTNFGGLTRVIATAGTVSGSTGLNLLLAETVNDPGSSNLPANPGSKFGGAVQAGRAPDLVYPNDGVLLPPNLGRLEIHFKAGTGNTLFELTFANTVTNVKVYLRCTALNTGCLYQPDPAVWRWLAETNRGGEALMISLKGTDDAGSAVGVSNAISVLFSHDDLSGGLYYWTTSNNTAIMRFDFGSTTQTMGTQFLGTELTGGTCVGCHALSRDGKKMVAEAGGQDDGRVLLLDVARKIPLVPFAQPPKSNFESWNPDGSRYVGIYGDTGATNYNLMLFDGNDGTLKATVAGTGTATNPADHPDWSPDGQKIAYVKIGEKGTGQRFGRGAIEVVSGSGDVFGAPAELVPAVAGKNHYYPAFAPDSSFLVYDESTCPAGETATKPCDADTDGTAILLAIKPSVGATPIPLVKANTPGRMDAGETALTDSYPKWSPFVFQRTGEFGSRLMWVTFSSTRNYGLRPPPDGGHDESDKGTLIWMTAIDPDKIASGSDGSYPAFALPFQDYTTSNHIAQWTTKVLPIIN